MINLLLNYLKIIGKNRGIKDYKNKSKDKLTKILSEPEPKTSIEKIRKKINESRDRFFKSKIKEIRRNLYEIETNNNLSTPEIKEIEKFFLNEKKYYDYDDTEYKGIRDVRNLIDLSIDEDYYKPIKTNDSFTNNYIGI